MNYEFTSNGVIDEYLLITIYYLLILLLWCRIAIDTLHCCVHLFNSSFIVLMVTIITRCMPYWNCIFLPVVMFEMHCTFLLRCRRVIKCNQQMLFSVYCSKLSSRQCVSFTFCSFLFYVGMLLVFLMIKVGLFLLFEIEATGLFYPKNALNARFCHLLLAPEFWLIRCCLMLTFQPNLELLFKILGWERLAAVICLSAEFRLSVNDKYLGVWFDP